MLFHLYIEASFGVMRVGQSPCKVEDFTLTSDRLAWLCLVLGVVTLYLVAQGTPVVAYHKRLWVDPHWLQGNSYLRIGWQWVRTALTRGWALFATLHLSRTPAPEPSRASASQSAPPRLVTFTWTFCCLPAECC